MNWQRKQLLEAIFSTLKSNNEESKHVFNELRRESQTVEDFLKKVSAWSVFYSLSFEELIIFLVVVSGLAQQLEQEKDDDEVDEFRLALFTRIPSLEVNLTKLDESMTDDDTVELMIQLLFATHFTMFAIAQRNRSLNEMLTEIREQVDGYESVIFEAVSIDPTVITNPEIAEILARWTLRGEGDHFDKLARALKGAYPAKRADYGNNLRTMMRMLEDIDGEVTIQSLLSVNELLELVREGTDIYSSLQKHLHTRRKDARRLKRDPTS